MATELIPVLDDDERARLLAVLRKSSRYPTGRRNRAMIELALYAGLRSSEVVGHEHRDGGGLRIRDVNLTTGELRLRDTKDTRARRSKKTRVGRVVWIEGAALDALRAYWTDRQAYDHEPDAYYFLTRTGERVSNRAFRAAYERYAERAGLPPEKRHPHVLRHTAGTDLARRGVPLHIVQAVLGHSSLRSTEVYLHASAVDVKRAMIG